MSATKRDETTADAQLRRLRARLLVLAADAQALHDTRGKGRGVRRFYAEKVAGKLAADLGETLLELDAGMDWSDDET